MQKSKKPILQLPISNLRDAFFRHAGDTFRELAEMWEEQSLVTIELVDDGYCWLLLGDERVLLYDRPTMDWWRRRRPQCNIALFGNHVPKELRIASPWTFWARRPRMLESERAAGLPSYQERKTTSIFVGKIENQVQQRFRDPSKWSGVIENFKLVIGKRTPYPYTQAEYLVHLKNSKFGLCLRGYGPKCNREIELMGLGTVPIVAPDVDMDDYYEPLKEGVHYLRAQSPDDVAGLIAGVDETRWNQMSQACLDWYRRNCAPVGSFYTTMAAIRSAQSPKDDEDGTALYTVPRYPIRSEAKRVLIDSVFFARPFSGISRVWNGLLEHCWKHFDGGHIEFVVLKRRDAQITIPGKLPYHTIDSFQYDAMERDVDYLDHVCEALNADFFISTYYTWTRAVPCIAMVHDMIPERFKLTRNAMWEQKDQCLANASHFICVSEATKRDLIAITPNATEENTSVVYNSFDPTVFERVDAKPVGAIHPENRPFVMVMASNTERYKNLRLVWQCVQMYPELFSQPLGMRLVVLSNNRIDTSSLADEVDVLTLSHVSDGELKWLYQNAAALIYPSRYEGFGLPVLEAFWNGCPVICCRNSGAISEVAQTHARYVDADDPTGLGNEVKKLLSNPQAPSNTDAARAVVSQFNPETQYGQFCAVFSEVGVASTGLKASSPNEEQLTTKVMDATPSATPSESQPAPFDGIHLIVQYFDCGDEDRQAEYDFCVQANLANSAIASVHCLLESETQPPEWLTSHAKYREHRLGRRLTYNDAFQYANEKLEGKVVGLSNLDIFLDHNSNWASVTQVLDMGIVLCLSRHEFDGVGESTKDPRLQNLAYANAQDAWIWRAPLFVKDCSFKMGMLGCDNAIAHRLKASGYIPINSPNEYKIHHFDIARGKRGDNFLAHHEANPEQPEERGFYLLPDYSAIDSVDKLIDRMGLGNVNRYRIICDVMTNYIRLSNPKPDNPPAAAEK